MCASKLRVCNSGQPRGHTLLISFGFASSILQKMPVTENDQEQRDVFFRQLINLEFEIEADIDELRQFAGPLTTMQQASTQIKTKLNKLNKKIKVPRAVHARATPPTLTLTLTLTSHTHTRTHAQRTHARTRHTHTPYAHAHTHTPFACMAMHSTQAT